ncbi:MAG: hypothetical protein JWM86_260 [Thermoleophilia bacterium]|nr:hypothetical protein [Thermoleophilia bacterium]
MAAVLAAGPGAVLTGPAAAQLWGIARRRSAQIDVLVARRHAPIDGIRVHQTRQLRPEDVTVHRGIPVTTVARTLVELADAGWSPELLANVMHEAAYRRRLNLRTLRATMRAHRSRRGYRALADALELHDSGSVGTRSGLEHRVLGLVRGWGYRPQVNVRVQVAGDSLEVDLLLAEHRLVIEVDGVGHRRARTRREDAARVRLLRAAGYGVIRVSEDDLDHDPDAVRTVVAAALRRNAGAVAI